MSQLLQERSLISVIDERRSVRAFSSRKIERATINALLDAAVRAPTAVDEEPWGFVVVQAPALLKQLSDLAKSSLEIAEHERLAHGGAFADALKRPEFNVFYDAGALVAIGTLKTGRFADADCWLAAENLMLTAWSMGLGSCVIGSAVPGLNTPEARQLLGMPADLAIVAPIAIGYPAKEADPTPRKVPRIIVWL